MDEKLVSVLFYVYMHCVQDFLFKKRINILTKKVVNAII